MTGETEMAKPKWQPFNDFSRLAGVDFYFGEKLIRTWLKADGDQRQSVASDIAIAAEEGQIEKLWLHKDGPEACKAGVLAAQGWLSALRELTEDKSGSAMRAATMFNQAWPEISDQDAAKGSLENAYAALLRDSPPDGVKADLLKHDHSIGAWAVKDILSGLNDPTKVRPSDAAAKLPVLFDNVANTKGYAAWLTVELFQATPTLFYPDPLKLGWTALPQGKESFHAALQRVWHLALKQTTSAYRGRWSLAGYGPKAEFAQSSLLGRSLEAAVACAVLAAHSNVLGHSAAKNGETSPALNFVDELDDRGTVSATLDGTATNVESWASWPLGMVEEKAVEAKLAAAHAAEIHLLILSHKQPAIPNELCNDVELEGTTAWFGLGVVPKTSEERRTMKRVLIRRVATLGEAYEILCERNRWLRSVQQFDAQDFWTFFDEAETKRLAGLRSAAATQEQGAS